jgi:purine-binding chemotaxis protein CheW
MAKAISYLVFGVGEGRYALDVAAVDRIVPAAEVAALPDAPEAVLGLINIAGEVMPVVDARCHLGLPAREMELTDRLIVTRAADQPLALLVDRTEGVVELSVRSLGETATARSGSTTTVATTADGIVLIQDVEVFASAARGSRGKERRE